MAQLRGLWKSLFRRGQAEAELDDELRAYVDLLAAEYERGGLSQEAAGRAALIKAGGIEQAKEATRDVWLGNAFAVAARELRYAGRTLRHSPTYLVIAIATLAIGIGGATAVFTVIKGSLLRPLPAVEDPGRLVAIERRTKAGTDAQFSYLDWVDFNTQAAALTGIAGFDGTSMRLEDAAGSDRVWVSFVSDNFFTVLGARPSAGRTFLTGPGWENREREPVVVLGDALWQRRFDRSASAIGSTIKLNGTIHTIIGVAPPRFIGAMATHPMEIWVPAVLQGRSSVSGDTDLTVRRDYLFRLIGRLAPGRRLADAERDLAAIPARLPVTNRANLGAIQVLPRTGMTVEERADASRVPRLLAIAVVLLLLIACGNVASLSLVRTSARRRELATRVALGASRGALVRQVAMEGALVAVGAGVLGVVVAHLLVRSATLMRTVVTVPDADLTIDPRVLGIALLTSTLAAVLVTLLPAMQVLRVAPSAVLKEGGGAIRRSMGGQRALVAAQIAATLVLLSATAVIASAFQRVLAAHDNLGPAELTDMRLDTDLAIKDTTGQVEFFREVLARVAMEPGVEGAALATTIPPFSWSGSQLVFRQGEEPPPGATVEQQSQTGTRVQAIRVSEQFFEVARVPIVRGRGFANTDTRTSEPSVVVSRRLAGLLWPGQDPIGRVLAWPPVSGPSRAPLRVIGVAEDTRDASLGEAPLAIYQPISQRHLSRLTLLVRGRPGSPVLPDAIRRLAASINPGVQVLGGQTLRDRLGSHVRPQQTASAWVGVFAGIALVLAVIGLYGIVAQSVLQRTRELAVRSALGASPARILGTVLGDGMRLVAIGTLVGGLGAVAVSHILTSLFAGVRTNDARPAFAAAAVLALVMLVGAYLPARRAARLNHVTALRTD